MRTTLDLSDDAYQIAKTVAREQKRSLGSVVSDFILGRFNSPFPSRPSEDQIFPTFRCGRVVTSEDVRALEDE
ncbi:MAG: antitoxin [Acidobacteriota bacterium]